MPLFVSDEKNPVINVTKIQACYFRSRQELLWDWFQEFYFISRTFNSCSNMGHLSLCTLLMIFGSMAGINCINTYTHDNGYYLVDTDCKGYSYGTVFGLSHHVCPEGQGFDSRTFSCVNSDTFNCTGNYLKRRPRSALNEPRRNILLNQLILPILQDMARDEETSKSLRYIFITAKSVYQIVMSEMFNNYQQSQGTSMHVSASTTNNAKERFLSKTRPTIERLMDKHLPLILRRFSQSFTTVNQGMEVINKNFNAHAGELRDSVITFVMKHKQILDSDSTYINSRNLPLLKRDFQPIKSVLLRVFDNYLRTRPLSWVNFINKRLDFLSL
ncbi:chitin-binding type-2 domain-containing protein [Trichonephila clavata]|uniref:Chitin-binding type-2 domain-containing protein n=1 Tax=Trichonephila clavata TaxID=2740835 RepID=A0A8X6FGP6_TRICU|nr:chitin-binding type-2 domain-containing protein [Trichonephila clavata]